MTVPDQVERLLTLGISEIAGLRDQAFRKLAQGLGGDGVLVVHPMLVPASRLAPLLSRESKPGFVVTDMTDLDEFAPIDGVDIPAEPLYLIADVDRGDDLLGWTPAEALPEIVSRGRRPLTVNEGISWLLQRPERLEPGRCFMTLGSRKRTARGLDARTPAIWISGGTGRDGKERKGAPKVGWCWAGNRHTWLGFASAHTSTVPPVRQYTLASRAKNPSSTR